MTGVASDMTRADLAKLLRDAQATDPPRPEKDKDPSSGKAE